MKNFGKRTENLDFANIGDIPTKLSQLTNDTGYLTVGTLPTNLVTTDKAQTITGLKTFDAPANISGTEQSTAIFKTSNGGQLIVGKEGANSGTMLRFDQVVGTVRLRFRASATAGAMVWEQPEQGAQLYIDLGKSGADYRRITFPSAAGTLALTAQIPTNYLTGGSQTTTSTEDGGSNIFTFTKANGQTATFTVKNGSKGSAGKDGENGLDALVYNNVIFVNSIPDEESKGNLTLKGGDFNRFPKNPETFWAIMSDNSGAEEAVHFIIDDYDPITDIASCGWLNRRNIKGEQGERGDDGVGISTATTGTPTVGTDGYTTTPITFKKTDNSTILVNVKAKNGKDGTDATITSINGLKGGTLTSPLVITGGDQATAAKIALNQGNKGQITDSSTSTIFGFMSSGTLTVGSTSYVINIRGKNTRPTYNGNNLALLSDVPTVNNGKLTIKQGGVEKGSFTANQSGNVEIDLESGSGVYYITYTAIHMSYSGAVDIMNSVPIKDFYCKLWISPLCTSDAFTTGSDFLSWLGANTFADETSGLACNGYSPQLGVACACWDDGSNVLYVKFSNGQVAMLYADSITISSNSFSAYL